MTQKILALLVSPAGRRPLGPGCAAEAVIKTP